MILNKEKFDEVVKPVIKYLNDNYNPHNIIIITADSAELLSGEHYLRTDEFIKD